MRDMDRLLTYVVTLNRNESQALHDQDVELVLETAVGGSYLAERIPCVGEILYLSRDSLGLHVLAKVTAVTTLHSSGDFDTRVNYPNVKVELIKDGDPILDGI